MEQINYSLSLVLISPSNKQNFKKRKEMSLKEKKEKLKKIKIIYNETDHLHYQVEMRTWEKAHE